MSNVVEKGRRVRPQAVCGGGGVSTRFSLVDNNDGNVNQSLLERPDGEGKEV